MKRILTIILNLCAWFIGQNVFSQIPNIILILVDDLGYGSVNLELNGLNAFNNPYVHTPRLAGFAKESLVMTHHYAAAPVSSPSRAGLLTGRTPTRCNINLYIEAKTDNDKVFLHGSEITIPELLKNKGYQTAIFGKWHLNGADWEKEENWNGWTGSFPMQQGFDHGIVSKENPYFTRELDVNTQKNPGDFFTIDGKPIGAIKGYTSDIISRYSNEWITEASKSDKPFFCFISYDAVHLRISAADKYEDMYNTGDARKDAYYANITHLDAAIGAVLDNLKKLKIEDNTIIIFSSDNGPEVLGPWEATFFSYGTSYPLKGQKYQLYEGSLRVPGIIRWPGKIKPRISDVPNSTIDLLPTLCALTGQEIPKDREIDGAGLLGFWKNDEPVKRIKPLYWQFEYTNIYEKTEGEGYERRFDGLSVNRSITKKPRVAVREDKYVLLGLGNEQFKEPFEFELYDVVSDPEQNKDLSKDKPDILNKMKKQLLTMYKEVSSERLKTEEAIINKKDKITFEK